MKTTNYDKLIAAQASTKGQIEHCIERLLRTGRCYPVEETGRGRHTKYDDCTIAIQGTLERLGIAFVEGNSAPRGGKLGNYIQITSPAFMKRVAIEEKAREAKEQEEAARRAAIAKEREEERANHRAEVQRLADEIDLNELRPLICSIADEFGYSLTKGEGLGRKQRGQICYRMSKIVRFNTEALMLKLEEFKF